jgi:hypothetical protein
MNETGTVKTLFREIKFYFPEIKAEIKICLIVCGLYQSSWGGARRKIKRKWHFKIVDTYLIRQKSGF